MENFELFNISLNLNKSLKLQNFKKIYLRQLSISIQDDSQISISNCELVVIDQVIIKDIQTHQGFIFLFTNNTNLRINQIHLTNSISSQFLKIRNSQTVNITNLNITNCSSVNNLFDLSQIRNLNIANTFLKDIYNSTIFYIKSTHLITIQEINIQKSQKTKTLQILKEEIDSIQYLCDTIIFKGFNLLDSLDGELYFEVKTIQLEDVNISNLTNSFTVFDIQVNQINISNINITNTQPLKKGLKLNLFNIISFTDSQIKNINSYNNQIPILSLNQQQIGGKAILTECQFLNISISDNHPLVLLNEIQDIELSNIAIKNVAYIDNYYTSILTIQNSDTVQITDSQFMNNINNNGPGGVIYATDNKVIKILNSQFQFNQCILQSGGAINLINQHFQGLLQMNKSQLAENKALLSFGGGIYLNNYNFILENSAIQSNEAQIGGGVYYNQIIPDFIIDLQNGFHNSNTFSDNFGKIYGQNVGSTLRNLKIDIENIKVPTGSLKSKIDENIMIKKFKSGDQIQFNKIQLLDEEHNPINLINLNSTEFNLLSNDVQTLIQQIIISADCEQQNEQIQCLGQLQTKQFYDGGFSLDVQVIYKPMSNMILKLVSNSLPQLKNSKGIAILDAKPLEFQIQIFLENCSVGQVFLPYGNSVACKTCPEGKYSLSLNDQECKSCPDSAVRCQGSNIELKDGYWRQNESTDNIYYCSLNPLPCKPQLSTSKFNCDLGHMGPMCQKCDTYGEVWGESYSEVFNAKKCYKCQQNFGLIIIYNLSIFIIIFAYILFIIRRIIIQQQSKLTGYFLNKLGIIYFGSTLNLSDRSQIISKILTDHLQILSLVCTFTANVPVSFTFPLQLSGDTASLTSKSIDCILSKYQSLKPLWLLQQFWSFTLPIGVSILYIIIGIVFNMFGVNIFLKYLRTAVIFIYFYFFPMVINLVTKSINCITIGNKKYLDFDLTIECFDKVQHKPYVFYYSIPVLFIWSIVIPLFLFYKIYTNKQKNVSIFMQVKYSFFFAGYKDQYYYWEFQKLVYKAILILISALLKQNIFLKVGITNLVLITQFYILVKVKPYARDYFNNLQQKSIMLCAISLNISFMEQMGVQNDLEYQAIFMLIIGSLNLCFLLILVIGLSRLFIQISQQDRNCLQTIIYNIKQKYPQLLDAQMQSKNKIKYLLKLRKVKLKIKQLMKYIKGQDIYSSQSFQSHFNIKKVDEKVKQTFSPVSNSEPDEKEFLFKGGNIKNLRKKWSYYTRSTNSNQTSLRSSQNQSIFALNYQSKDSILESQSSAKSILDKKLHFHDQLSENTN